MKLIPTAKDLPHGYTRKVTLLDILGPYIQVVYSAPLNLFKPFPPTHHHSIRMLSLPAELWSSSASESSALNMPFSQCKILSPCNLKQHTLLFLKCTIGYSQLLFTHTSIKTNIGPFTVNIKLWKLRWHNGRLPLISNFFLACTSISDIKLSGKQNKTNKNPPQPSLVMNPWLFYLKPRISTKVSLKTKRVAPYFSHSNKTCQLSEFTISS